MKSENQKAHDYLRGYIESTRGLEVYRYLSSGMRLAQVALTMSMIKELYYGCGIEDGSGGSYYRFNSKKGEPATFKYSFLGQLWGDKPPGLECGGFVEAALYASGISTGRVIDYHNRRLVPRDVKLFREASKGHEDYDVNWIPSPPDRPNTIVGDAGFGGTWASTPILIFYDPLFIPWPRREHPHIGDLVFFMSKDMKGYHYHVGIWGRLYGEDGLIHSSPLWPPKSPESGPKFTAFDSEYYRWLGPQRRLWEEWHGASIVALKDA